MTAPSLTLKGRELLLAVCGGIAAYKSADLCSKLVQQGAGVTVVMTKEATKFITPLTFQALSARPVHSDTFELLDSSDPQHIRLTERSDLLIVAPATTNIIAKVAAGISDDLVSLMIAAAACPVLFCPAANSRMWTNPIAQQNARKLMDLGYPFLGPDDGWLACRTVGPGRMAEVETILAEVTRRLADSGKQLSPDPSQM